MEEENRNQPPDGAVDDTGDVEISEPEAGGRFRKKRPKHKAKAPDPKLKTQASGEPEAKQDLALEVEASQNRLLRLQADFDNFRKRMLREKEDLWLRAHADVIEELLPVLDHMDLALEAADTHGAPSSFVEGFLLVRGQMGAALKKFGLTPQEALGKEFDPNFHEAVAHMPSDDVQANHVVAQARRGYLLGDKLLRAAQVVVSSGAPGGDGQSEPAAGEAEADSQA